MKGKFTSTGQVLWWTLKTQLGNGKRSESVSRIQTRASLSSSSELFFFKKKNVNVLPICSGRINLHSHLKGLTTLFSLCRAGWVPCPGFLKRPSPSWQFPGLPLQWTWSKGKENRAAEPRGIKLKQQICFLASLLNMFRVFKALKGNALGPWMWEAHLNPFPRGNLSPRWGKLAH